MKESQAHRSCRRGLLRTLTLITFLSAGAQASAAKISVLPIDPNTESVLVIGEIRAGDAARFRSVPLSGKRVLVMLESQGGNISEALAIGEYIYAKRFGTMVINDSYCNSACALIWLAGRPRSLSRSAKVGFHAAYTMGERGDARESGAANALVGRYLTMLDLPKSAVLFATTAPPDQMNFLTAFNNEAVGMSAKIVKDVSEDEDTNSDSASSTAKAAKPDLELWKDVGMWHVGIDHTIADNCFISSKFEDQTALRIGVQDISKKQFYVIFMNPKWRSLKADESYRLTIEFDQFGSWDFPTTAGVLDGSPSLYGQFSDVNFWSEYIRAKAMRIATGGKSVTKLNMSGSSAAFEELGRCQRNQNAQRANSDPFAK